MKVDNLEQLAGQVSPQDACRYALAKGWERVPDVNGGFVLFQRADSDLMQLIIPVRSTGPDYARRIMDVLTNLAEWERRPREEILSDLLFPDAARDPVEGESCREAVNERRRAMSPGEVVIEGTLKPDGTLELDQKPNLAPGRVTVVLRQGAKAMPPRPLDDAFFRMMEEIWAGQRARGHVPRSEEEVEAERRQLRQEWEAEIEEAIRLQEESRRLRQQAEHGKETP